MGIDTELAAFAAALGAAVESVMETEVFDEARRAIVESVETNVYARYDPTMYERKREQGGLTDPANIQITGRDFAGDSYSITVRDMRSDGGRDVSEVVESGEGYTWENSRIYQMQPYPRPFHAPAEELLDAGRFEAALEQGLKLRGF